MLSQLASISLYFFAIVSLAAYNNGRQFCGNKHLQLLLVDESMLVGFGRHFTRLNAGAAASHETSAIHLDLLTHLRRVNSAVSHVAFAVLLSPEPVG